MLVALDIVLINTGYIISFLLRFEGNLNNNFMDVYFTHCLIYTMIKIICLIYFKIYKSLWKYASIDEVIQIFNASFLGNIMVLAYTFIVGAHLPRSIYILAGIMDVLLIGGSRFSYRIVRRIKNGERLYKRKGKRVLIIGAGDAAAAVIKEYKNHPNLNSYVVALIDDNREKFGKRIHGVQVVGDRNSVTEVAKKYSIDEIIISIPSGNKKDIRDITKICSKTDCDLKTLPGIYELIDGKVSINSIRPVSIEDLLGRDEVDLNVNRISSYIKNKTVMITGGGGSIGSELARQIVFFKPKKLILLDIYENCVYDLQNELMRLLRDIELKVVIASVRDYKRLDSILRCENVDVIFHAAAHKHVPLMEHSPGESIKNNVIGTYNIAKCAHENNVERFVMISTDKAVNPTNIMGASKRFAEIIVQSLNEISSTEFVAVRFGNVLGSNGSVIPLFKRQIEKGGPVTVTHQEITRYFMTIPEASQLVIQAGAMANGGEIFILDMGDPVKIIDLAKDLITLSGYKPYDDIPIMITGLRPGEKLYEELLMAEEGLQSTVHNKIFVGAPTFSNFEIVEERIKYLKALLDNCEDSKIIEVMAGYIDTYKPNRNGV
ncbi:MAG: polysaccharide biosynthesis protein [Firmicutes bacterium]|nr:polysaccharide biosynthesis protein [Bacillota bacterium]